MTVVPTGIRLKSQPMSIEYLDCEMQIADVKSTKFNPTLFTAWLSVPVDQLVIISVTKFHRDG